MNPTSIIIHHSASNRDKTTIQALDSWHRLRWPDFKSSLGFYCGYHYIITGDGKITQTRRDNELGAHCIPNKGKIGICVVGNFMIESPSDVQLNSLDILLDRIKKDYNFQDKDIFAHRELSRTDCPGDNLMKWIYLKRKISILQKLILSLRQKLEIKS